MEIFETMMALLKTYLSAFTLLCGLPIFLLSGCDMLFPESGIERDKREQREVVNGFFATYWKGAKISLRSIPVDADTETMDFAAIREQQAQDLNLGKHLRKIYDWESPLTNKPTGETKQLTTKEFLELAQETYLLSDALEGIDEDAYPTFGEIVHHSSRILKKEPTELPAFWNNSMDHWMFALVLESGFNLGSCRTYELDKVRPHELPSSDYRIFAALHKGVDHLRNRWYYLADESFSKAIAETDSKNITLQEHTRESLRNSPIGSFSPEEQFRLVARAASYLLRGFSRQQTDDEALRQKAFEDIEAALADFHTLGMENELVWLAESYLYIHNEEQEKAVAALAKLQRSNLLTTREHRLLEDAKTHITNRDPESALNIITDKMIVYELGFSYTLSYASEIHWMKLLTTTAQEQKITERFKEWEQVLDKTSKYLSVDRLKEVWK